VNPAYTVIPTLTLVQVGMYRAPLPRSKDSCTTYTYVLNSYPCSFELTRHMQTLPGVAIAMIITSMWAWTDIEIKKMQPYVDLTHGNATPKRSLLLDYTRTKCVISLQPASGLFPVRCSWSDANLKRLCRVDRSGAQSTLCRHTRFAYGYPYALLLSALRLALHHS
jgi:hypothetical protein